jgi:hypothetical protein
MSPRLYSYKSKLLESSDVFSTNWEICIVSSLLKDEKEEVYSDKISSMMIGRLRGKPKFKSRAVRVNNSLLHTILMRWFYRRTHVITWKDSVDCTQADYMFILQLSTKGYDDDFETNSTFKDRMWKTISWTLSTADAGIHLQTSGND